MPLISVTVVRTVSFSLYSKSKQLYANTFRTAFGDRYFSAPDQPTKPLNPIYWFLSGATAGGCITFIACE
jgi:solute carrier family 25 carnitine/acylcarnitine transporter 20/29